MFVTQLILVVVLVGIAVYLLRSEPSAAHLALRRLAVILALVAGVVVIIWPGLLTSVANLLGIGRGTDLLLYAAIIAFILYVASDYKKTIMITRAQTELARALTLNQARLEDELVRRDQSADGGRRDVSAGR